MDRRKKTDTKRGFKTKREAQAWEREQLIKAKADIDMTFSSFVELYRTDLGMRIEPFIKRIMKIIENLARRCYRAEKIAEQAEATTTLNDKIFSLNNLYGNVPHSRVGV